MLYMLCDLYGLKPSSKQYYKVSEFQGETRIPENLKVDDCYHACNLMLALFTLSDTHQYYSH